MCSTACAVVVWPSVGDGTQGADADGNSLATPNAVSGKVLSLQPPGIGGLQLVSRKL
jgi:hypothetical protein